MPRDIKGHYYSCVLSAMLRAGVGAFLYNCHKRTKGRLLAVDLCKHYNIERFSQRINVDQAFPICDGS